MFKRILLATDGSKHSNRAADAALSLAKEIDGVFVTLLHVSTTAPSRNRLINYQFDVKAALEDAAHEQIIHTEYKFKNADVPYKLEVALGDPAEEIVFASEEGGHDLIILGSRGLNKISEVLLGSVSHQVAHQAKCPVMIVK